MDNSVLISIIIATIAIVPGLWSLINQARKDNIETRMDMIRTIENTTNNESLFKKMYEKPVVIRCGHCQSPNIITSLNCIRCGAPLGD